MSWDGSKSFGSLLVLECSVEFVGWDACFSMFRVLLVLVTCRFRLTVEAECLGLLNELLWARLD